VVWFTEDELNELATGRSYERGLGYVDAVGDIADLPDGVVATVHGSMTYRVRLTGVDGGELVGECSCPYGRDGAFCKHCVAVGLCLLRRKSSASRRTAEGVVRRFLDAMDHADLVELVWRHAAEDPVLFQRLRLLASTGDGEPDLAALRADVDGLAVDWIGYGDERAYALRARPVIEALERLVPRHAEAVRSLLQLAVAMIGSAAEVCEEDGSTVAEVAVQAWDAYLSACAAAPPDQAELGTWFADFQLTGPEYPHRTLDDMSELLDDVGLAAYRERLDEVAAEGGHWRLRWLREELVGATADTDALIAVIAEDLSNPHQYQRIAHLLRGDARTDEAIKWLERGVHSERGWVLVDPLAEMYAEAGRVDDAIALRERHFMATGDGVAYRALRDAARETPRWPEIHARAFAMLRERAASKSWYAETTLVRLLIEEGEVEDAWEVAQKYGCADQATRVALADRRGETHPGDAIGVFRPMVTAAIERTSKGGYEEAVALLVKLRGLYARTGDDFAAEVGRLRETHRRKRNFLAALSRENL
jgi:uncharacterized Zn finger protein